MQFLGIYRDEGIPTTPSSSPPNAHDIRLELPTGPITRACAKKLQTQVILLLNEHVIDFNENFILPKNSVLLVLRFEDSLMDGDQGYANVIQGGQGAGLWAIRPKRGVPTSMRPREGSKPKRSSIKPT